MKRILPVLLVLIVGLTSVACGTGDQERPTSPSQSPSPKDSTASSPSPVFQQSPAPDQEIALDRQYVNERFGFSIRYPDAWEATESQNGDGATFDTGKSGQQIRAYGANYMSEFAEPYERAGQEGFTLREIILDSGARAAVIEGDAGGRHIYEMVAVHEQIEYHIVFELTQDYYDAHQSLIEAVAASFAYTES